MGVGLNYCSQNGFGVISTLAIPITIIALLLTPCISSHGPPSRQPAWSKWNIFIERTLIYSLYTAYSIYFRMVIIWYAMTHYTISRYDVLYYTLLYSTLLYSTLLYSSLLYSTLLYSALLYYATMLDYTMQCYGGILMLYPKLPSRTRKVRHTSLTACAARLPRTIPTAAKQSPWKGPLKQGWYHIGHIGNILGIFQRSYSIYSSMAVPTWEFPKKEGHLIRSQTIRSLT